MWYEQSIMAERFQDILLDDIEARSCSQLKPNESLLLSVRRSNEVPELNSFHHYCEVSPTVRARSSPTDHNF